MKKLFLVLISGIGLAIFFWNCCILKESRDALNWPQTKGEIISSSLTVDHLPKFLDFKGDSLRLYGTDVEYQYPVKDMLFESNRLSFQTGESRNPRAALKVMNQYRRHHAITVYYDPKEPDQSVLEPWDISDTFIPLMIGALLAVLGLFSLATQAIEFSNRGLDSFVHHGQMYQDQGRFEEAIWEYNQIIRSEPYLAMGYSKRGDIYLQQEHWGRAIADFNRAIALGSSNALIYFNLGKAYLGQKEYDKALDNMHKAMAKGFPVNPEILENIKNQHR